MSKKYLTTLSLLIGLLISQEVISAVHFLPRYQARLSGRAESGGREETALSCSQKGLYDLPKDSCRSCQQVVGSCCASITCKTSSGCYEYSEEEGLSNDCDSDVCRDGQGVHYKGCEARLSCETVDLLSEGESVAYSSSGYSCQKIYVSCMVNGLTLGTCRYGIGEIEGGNTGDIGNGGIIGGGIGHIKSVTCYRCNCPEGMQEEKEGEHCELGLSVGGKNCYKCQCQPGSYSSTDGYYPCEVCPEGSYNENYGSTSCKGCPAGYSSKSGITGATSIEEACELCPEGSYKINLGPGKCTGCPTGYVAISGVTGASSMAQACKLPCVPCDSKEYPLFSCPENAECEKCTPSHCDDNTSKYAIISCRKGFKNTGTSCVPDGAIKFVVDSQLDSTVSFGISRYSTEDSVDVDIDWGDGVKENYIGNHAVSHTYETQGRYTVSIVGSLPKMGRVTTLNVVELKQLDISTAKDLASVFYEQEQLTGSIPKLPDGLISGSSMFNGCSGLRGNIPELPNTLTNGAAMFSGCSGLTGELPELREGLININSMFRGCSGLTGSIPKLPTGLKNGNWLFTGCKGLTGSLPELPQGLQTGVEMFRGNSGLTGEIPELPTTLTDGKFMFSGCSKLTGNIPELPQGLINGGNMFGGCSALTGSIPKLPENLLDAEGMFSYCSSLTGIIPELPKT